MAQIFEDFSLGPLPNMGGSSGSDSALESFDKGYKAGWDDAAKAHSESQQHVSGMLGRNVEALEFTLVEARALLLDAIKPVLEEIAETLLPSISADALQAAFLAELTQLLDTALPSEMQIDVSPGDHIAISALLDEQNLTGKVSVNVRDTLGDGQVYMSVEDATKRIDIPGAIAGIADALAAFDPLSTHQELEQAHAG